MFVPKRDIAPPAWVKPWHLWIVVVRLQVRTSTESPPILSSFSFLFSVPRPKCRDVASYYAPTYFFTSFRILSVDAMKAYGGVILNFGARWSWVVSLTCRSRYSLERSPRPAEGEADWAPKAGLKVWKRETSLAFARIWTPDCSVRSLVAIQTTHPSIHCHDLWVAPLIKRRKTEANFRLPPPYR
jgi:hypothetical protein